MQNFADDKKATHKITNCYTVARKWNHCSEQFNFIFIGACILHRRAEAVVLASATGVYPLFLQVFLYNIMFTR